jgi:hypothetical protein
MNIINSYHKSPDTHSCVQTKPSSHHADFPRNVHNFRHYNYQTLLRMKKHPHTRDQHTALRYMFFRLRLKLPQFESFRLNFREIQLFLFSGSALLDGNFEGGGGPMGARRACPSFGAVLWR